MNRSVRTALAFTICSLLAASAADAQVARSWVSGVGDDVNPCSRTAPCKTFAAAFDVTIAGGEISALDPAGFGPLVITSSITLNGDGTLASILANGTNAITINAPGAIVTLRNLSLIGPNGLGLKGVELIAGSVILDRVTISGFETGVSAAAGNVMIVNSTITRNTGFGVRALGGSITLETSTLANNGVGAQADAGAEVNLANVGFYNNLTGFGCGGGMVASAGNNRKANNVGGVLNSSACLPLAAIPLR